MLKFWVSLIVAKRWVRMALGSLEESAERARRFYQDVSRPCEVTFGAGHYLGVLHQLLLPLLSRADGYSSRAWRVLRCCMCISTTNPSSHVEESGDLRCCPST